MKPTEMLTTREVAAVLGVSRETVRNRTVNRVRRGKGTQIAYEMDGRTLRYHRSDVLAYQDRIRRGTTPDDTVAPVTAAPAARPTPTAAVKPPPAVQTPPAVPPAPPPGLNGLADLCGALERLAEGFDTQDRRTLRFLFRELFDDLSGVLKRAAEKEYESERSRQRAGRNSETRPGGRGRGK